MVKVRMQPVQSNFGKGLAWLNPGYYCTHVMYLFYFGNIAVHVKIIGEGGFLSTMQSASIDHKTL